MLEHGTEGCNYLLAVDVDMNTVDGYAISSWETRLRRHVLRDGPLHAAAHAGAPGVGDDPERPHLARRQRRGRAVAAGHPQARRSAAAEADGYAAFAGTELEFILFEESYDDAWDRRYHGLTGANRYNVDYSILGGSKVEPVLREIRNEMYAAGMNVESAKGECNFGQHEIGFLFDGVLRTCDNHSVYKTGAKEIAARHGQSLTFMAKFDEREGNSCHIHLSLRGTDGEVVFADDDRDGGRSELFDQFMAGLLATMRELTYFYAPNINSYKRFAAGRSRRPPSPGARDNRTCALRVVGHGSGLRVENRLPGGDVNPYLAVAAMMAGGLHGIREGLELPPVCEGNAYVGDYEHVPGTLAEARDLLAGSAIARGAFGDDVVDHYVNAADVEIAAFNAAVTDWERVRGFERL